jgi:nucleoside-diphosphate-sugar epimerase
MDLLTGATGFLGSHLARRLAREGRKLRALVRPGTDWKRIPVEVEEVVWGDLTEPDALERATAGVEFVFHTAARVSGSGSRAAFHAANVAATEALLEAARAAGAERFVHVSSAGIYGAESASGAITEGTPLDPSIEQRGAYAWSKAEADRLVREFAARHQFPAIVVRPGILYGPGAKPFFARLHLPFPLKRSRRVIIGSPQALLPLTYVENACDAIVLAAQRGTPGEAYNVVDGVTSQAAYLKALAEAGARFETPLFVSQGFVVPVALACEIAGRLAKRNLPLTRYRLRRATESLRYDTTKAQHELGWTPKVGLAEGLERTFSGEAPPSRTPATPLRQAS